GKTQLVVFRAGRSHVRRLPLRLPRPLLVVDSLPLRPPPPHPRHHAHLVRQRTGPLYPRHHLASPRPRLPHQTLRRQRHRLLHVSGPRAHHLSTLQPPGRADVFDLAGHQDRPPAPPPLLHRDGPC